MAGYSLNFSYKFSVVSVILKTNDDALCCSCSYYGIFDGHGGARASKYAAENIHKNLKERLPKGAQRVLHTLIRNQLFHSGNSQTIMPHNNSYEDHSASNHPIFRQIPLVPFQI